MTDSAANCLLLFQFGKVQFHFRNYSDSTSLALTPNLRSRTSTNFRLQLRRSSCPVVSLPSCSRSAASRCSSSLSSVSDMDASGGQSVYPLHRCKTIHLVRHAQGFHNVEGEKDQNAYLLPHLFDANLTPLGWQQVDNLRKHVNSTGLSKRVALVVTSPLLRTIQTAVGVFGGEGYADDIQGLPLMVANAGNSSRPAISSLNCPPFLAMELCREHIIEHDDDYLWKEDIRETDEELATRGMTFLNWLLKRKEKEIAVVTHSGFLTHTLKQFGNDCNLNVKNEICRQFKNCELRSMVIVDKCMIGTDTPTTDYPGKIPSGSDVPSD
nr:phosphoglycerate mutase-like protein 1 isoform X1 [Ipomoea batatas]